MHDRADNGQATEDLLRHAQCGRVRRKPLADVCRLCLDDRLRGPRIADAWFAALAIEWGCEWVTLDRDFARFPSLKWRTPGDA
jgi:predicted nucleic acid-binding protein